MWHTGIVRKLVRTFIKPIRKVFILSVFVVMSFKENACLDLSVTILHFRWKLNLR